jgi:hypothetical protein
MKTVRENPKPEARGPKEIRIPNSEAQSARAFSIFRPDWGSVFGVRGSFAFLNSDFGF